MTLLGIALPVYNDADALPDAIEAVLNQTYQDFELHIFDNCSTDNSYEIAQEYAKKDNRIFVHRNSINIGLSDNFNKCLALNGYDYITIKSANDMINNTYYEKCVDFLNNNEDFVLCYTEGTNTLKYGGFFSYEEEDIYERLESIVKTFKYGNMIYGVYRRTVLDKCFPFYPILGNDHVVMFNLAINGKLKKIDEVLYDREQPINRTHEQYIRLAKSGLKSTPYLNAPISKAMEMLLGYVNVCNNGYLNGLDRDKLIDIVVQTLFEKRKRDLVDGYFAVKKWLKKNKKVNDIDYYELKTFLRRVRFYMLKNKRFRKHHPIEWLKGTLDRLFV